MFIGSMPISNFHGFLSLWKREQEYREWSVRIALPRCLPTLVDAFATNCTPMFPKNIILDFLRV